MIPMMRRLTGVSFLTNDEAVSLGFTVQEADSVRSAFSNGEIYCIGHVIEVIKRFEAFAAGYRDRAAGRPCKSANGTYLDGYCAESVYPDFLNTEQAICLRNRLTRFLTANEAQYLAPR